MKKLWQGILAYVRDEDDDKYTPKPYFVWLWPVYWLARFIFGVVILAILAVPLLGPGILGIQVGGMYGWGVAVVGYYVVVSLWLKYKHD